MYNFDKDKMMGFEFELDGTFTAYIYRPDLSQVGEFNTTDGEFKISRKFTGPDAYKFYCQKFLSAKAGDFGVKFISELNFDKQNENLKQSNNDNE